MQCPPATELTTQIHSPCKEIETDLIIPLRKLSKFQLISVSKHLHFIVGQLCRDTPTFLRKCRDLML